MARTGFLTLFVTRLHPDAAIRSCRVDRATVVGSEERARHGHQNRFPLRPDFVDHLIHRLAFVMLVGVDQPWLAEDVQIIALDKEWSLAARPTLIAFISWHGRHSITIGFVRKAS